MTPQSRQSRGKRITSLAKMLSGGTERGLRRYEAQAAEHVVVAFVNTKEPSASAWRVLWLLEALIKAETLRLALAKGPLDEIIRRRFSDPKLQEVNLQFHATMRDIERHLKRYRWAPKISSVGFSRLEPGVTWSRKSKEEDRENRAVRWLIHHALEGSSDISPSRIRQCRQCNTWFYAVVDHQWHCSTQCRKKFHSESPEFKKKRADYMRAWRSDPKDPRNKERSRRAFRLASIEQRSKK